MHTSMHASLFEYILSSGSLEVYKFAVREGDHTYQFPAKVVRGARLRILGLCLFVYLFGAEARKKYIN